MHSSNEPTANSDRQTAEAAFWGRLQRKLNHDFCPGANRWVYWMKNPLAVLVLSTVVAIFCSIYLSPNTWILAGTLVFVSLLGVVWPWVAMRGVECELEFLRSRIRLGETVVVKLKIKNRVPWPVWGLALERGFQRSSGQSSESEDTVALSRLPGWSEQEYHWEFSPSARGTYPTTAPTIETRFPFGLIRNEKSLSSCNELIVWPREVSLDSLPDSASASERDDIFSDRRVGDFGDMLGTRLFRPGDSLRRVHWAQTARHQTAIVTERQAPLRTAVRIVADLHESQHFRGDSFDTLELTLSLMSSLCHSLVRQHCDVECSVGGRSFIPSRSIAELNRFRDALAKVPENGYVNDSIPELPATHSKRSRGDDLLEIEIRSARFTGGSSVARRGSRNRKLIVVGETLSCARTDHPWVEVPLSEDALNVLPEQWRRACRAN